MSTLIAGQTHSLTARFGGGADFGPSVSPTYYEAVYAPAPPVVVPVVTGPRLVNLQRVAAASVLVLTFDQPVNAATADLMANYQIHDLVTHPVGIKSAVLASDGMTLRLTLTTALRPRVRYVLAVNGLTPFGLTGTNGLGLNGNSAGVAGSDTVTPFTYRDLSVAPRPPVVKRLAVSHPRAVQPARHR